ncbi:hypothetical protein ACJ5NV_13405 [Loktanella agnita]|uniref:hypothetical protein n=1 Tax=Loktanella agnita TaxID=287097 RepID=UPI003987C1EB
MDTTLTLSPKAIAVPVYIPEVQRPDDHKVPVVKALDTIATLPADKAFIAQVVNARLAGASYPENPAEIAPPERTLRPYNVPMLPADKEEDIFETEEVKETAAEEEEAETVTKPEKQATAEQEPTRDAATQPNDSFATRDADQAETPEPTFETADDTADETTGD